MFPCIAGWSHEELFAQWALQSLTLNTNQGSVFRLLFLAFHLHYYIKATTAEKSKNLYFCFNVHILQFKTVSLYPRSKYLKPDWKPFIWSVLMEIGLFCSLSGSTNTEYNPPRKRFLLIASFSSSLCKKLLLLQIRLCSFMKSPADVFKILHV